MKDVIQTVGGYAGIISLLGVVVLAMLCFSQARDLRRLREWAGGAPERDAEVREVSELVAEERSQELRVLAEREERRLERSGMIEGSFWDRLGRTGRILAIIAAVVVLGAGAAYAGTTLLGSDEPSTSSGPGKKKQAANPGVRPAQTRVAVLNGTGGAEVGIADEYATVLEAAGFQMGVVTDATETFTSSVVMYSPGNQAAAKKVGRTVDIDATEPITSSVEAITTGADAVAIIGTTHSALPGG
ncbi:MAG: LytR C-terminal domain-containing protein [Actinomycetota bacterium]|nr:LytR C-terminal domain-containing protein [Actinomycetota bacterium]